MKRALVGALVALAICVGTASGDVFSVSSASDTIGMGFGLPGGPVNLPSSSVPNASGSLHLADGWTEHARTQYQLSSAQLRSLWQSAGEAYGIPWAVLAAINKIESNFGQNMGPSSAGAVGWMQFMPDTWLRWGYDFDGDGYADPWSPYDGVYSAARYLAAAGGATDITRAVFSYNHAQWYVDEVLSLAKTISGDPTFSAQIDTYQVAIQQAEQKVAKLNQQIEQIRARIQAIRARSAGIARKAERASLITDRSALRMHSGDVMAGAAALEAQLPELTSKLARAEKALTRAQKRAQPTTFVGGPSTASAAGASYNNGYVFPVGGGPTLVSVSHHHHDYPAADIAAPAGSPVYALADGVVVSAWQGIDPLCGIGMVYRTDDGQTWAYCHFSYREPVVTVGARLVAGTLVGLVGSTGHATGPHLHLGLRPASRYPQTEAWFESFAGIAFRWQDAPTPSFQTAIGLPHAPVVLNVLESGASTSKDTGASTVTGDLPAWSSSRKVTSAPTTFSAPPSGSSPTTGAGSANVQGPLVTFTN